MKLPRKIKAAGKNRKVLLDLRDSSGDDAEQGIRLANFFISRERWPRSRGRNFPPRLSPPMRPRC